MGTLWSRSQLNSYEPMLEMHLKQITSLSSYILYIGHLFSDQIYHIGHTRICLFCPNKSTPDYLNICGSNIMKQFAYGLLSLNRNVQIMLKNKTTWEMRMIQFELRHWHKHNECYVCVCVDFGREFYVKAYFLRRTLVHKACKDCGKTSPHRKCKHVSSPNITKEDALKSFLHSYHYKVHLK